jgi:excisionase family DNA binding protein
MNNTNQYQIFTPEQVAEILQLSKNSVYQLIKEGEIVAKKYGNVYRIPKSSLSFLFTGLDQDLLQKEAIDLKVMEDIHATLASIRQSKQP